MCKVPALSRFAGEVRLDLESKTPFSSSTFISSYAFLSWSWYLTLSNFSYICRWRKKEAKVAMNGSESSTSTQEEEEEEEGHIGWGIPQLHLLWVGVRTRRGRHSCRTWARLPTCWALRRSLRPARRAAVPLRREGSVCSWRWNASSSWRPCALHTRPHVVMDMDMDMDMETMWELVCWIENFMMMMMMKKKKMKRWMELLLTSDLSLALWTAPCEQRWAEWASLA